MIKAVLTIILLILIGIDYTIIKTICTKEIDQFINSSESDDLREYINWPKETLIKVIYNINAIAATIVSVCIIVLGYVIFTM